MKAPKNYYNVVDQKKLGLDQIDKNAAAIAELQDLPVLPTPGDGDLGKVPKVNSEGGYTLGPDLGLPEVTSADNGKILQVQNGEWDFRTIGASSLLVTSAGGLINNTKALGFRIVNSAGTISKTYLVNAVTISAAISYISDNVIPLYISDGGNKYYGIATSTGTNSIKGIVINDKTVYSVEITDTTITYQRVSPITLDVTISGSSVTLPTGYDYATIKALVDADVDVRLYDNTSVYVISANQTRSVEFESVSQSDEQIIGRKIKIDDEDTYTYGITRVNKTKYINITISGSSATLPSGITYSDVKNDLDNGIDIKLVDGADIYTIAEYDNVDLKAYTFDMGLAELYAKEIQLHSDGTGSYTMMTISGTT